jgi:hypothetical protein
MLQFLITCDAVYGSADAEGRRPLKVEYRRRFGGGRLYASPKMQLAPGAGRRVVCAQQANRELRPFLYGFDELGRDYDVVNCQPEVLRQLADTLTFDGAARALDNSELSLWCADRSGFIAHVAEVHALPEDADRFEGYRKDTVKELVIRLIFGGTYSAGIADLRGEESPHEPRSPRVLVLAEQLAALRRATFQSDQWKAFYASDAVRLAKGGQKGSLEEVQRAVFARICQSEEDRILRSMCAYFEEWGYKPLALCFDGLVVADKGRAPNLEKMQRRITRETSYKVEVVEKPLWLERGEVPVLSLARAD